MTPPIRTRPSFHPSQFLPSESFHKLLILISQRGRQNENHSHRKLSNWSHGPQPCLTQWNYEPCRVGPPKMDRSWWRVLHKMWSTGEGNGKPLLFSCLENPMSSTKKQKERTLNDELPRSVGARYATGDQWKNNSRKNEETEQKWKQCPVEDVTGDGSKVWCCKNTA